MLTGFQRVSNRLKKKLTQRLTKQNLCKSNKVQIKFLGRMRGRMLEIRTNVLEIFNNSEYNIITCGIRSFS